MAVRWWLVMMTGELFLFAWRLETTLAEGENFYDFLCVSNKRARDGYQYISPNLTFPCDGTVTKWKIGTEDKDDKQVYLQIWRPTETDYTCVAETVYTHSGGGTISEVLTNMTVSAGDVIGFFIPRGGKEGLRVAWAPVSDHTLLQGRMRSAAGVSPVATFSDNPSTLSSSPLVSVIFEPSTLTCSSSDTPTHVSDCLGAFNDFNQLVCGERVADNAQYIIPELNFSCNGTVTQWKVGLEGGGRGQSVSLQIWRSVGAGQYTSVTEVVYTKTVADERIASVPVSMSVMAGDMVGFYVPGGQLQPHTLPGVGLIMYTTWGSPTSSLSSLGPTVGPSPYISVVFVPDVTRSFVIIVTVAGSMDPSSKFPLAPFGGGPSTQVSGTIIGTVVAAVVVLVVGSVFLAASLIAWKVRSTKASTGAQVSPPEVNTVVTMQDSPSYSTVEGGPILQANPAYMKTSSRVNSPLEVSTVVTMQDSPSYSTLKGGPIIQPNPAYMKTSYVTMQANPSYTAVEEGVTLGPNPCYSAVQATSTYEPINSHDPSCDYDYIWPSQAQ